MTCVANVWRIGALYLILCLNDRVPLVNHSENDIVVSARLSRCQAGGAVRDRAGARDFLPAAGVFALLLVFLTVAWITGTAGSGRYLVVAKPGSGLGETVGLVRKAHGRLIGAGPFPNSVLVDAGGTDFAASVRKSGGGMVLSMRAEALCSDK